MSKTLQYVLLFHFQGLQPYSFGYEVKDPEGALDFGHRETSDGVTVSGLYHVLLPDGRRQGGSVDA